MTNSEYVEAINIRHSRRSYKQKPLDENTMNIVKEMVGAINNNKNCNFQFVEDATPAFTFFSGKFSMVVISGEDSQKGREDCGYYGESILLQCVYHGLGTCWVSGTYSENKVYQITNLPKTEKIYGVITIGNVKNSLSPKEKIMYSATHKTNRPYQKMFTTCDVKLPEEYVYAMKLVEKGPSAVNRRPVKFKYENGVISGSVDTPYSDKSIDFGIAKLHFKIGCAKMGIKGNWSYDNKFIVENKDENKIIKFKGDNENE